MTRLPDDDDDSESFVGVQGIDLDESEGGECHSYLHQPDCLYLEAYEDALPPKPGRQHHLTTYSNACWGSQIGNAIYAGALLPLFKFCSMSGAVVF